MNFLPLPLLGNPQAIDKIVSEMRELIDGEDLDVFNKYLLHPV